MNRPVSNKFSQNYSSKSEAESVLFPSAPGPINSSRSNLAKANIAYSVTCHLSISAPFYGYLKILKLHRKERSRKKDLLHMGIKFRASRTEGVAH